jgi:hypothetical protein
LFLFTEVEGVCGGISYGIRPLVMCLPAWWRFAQCLRRYRESRLVFPHIVNAGKYSTTFLVVLFSSLNTAYTSEHELLLISISLCLLLSTSISLCFHLIPSYIHSLDLSFSQSLIHLITHLLIYPHSTFIY